MIFIDADIGFNPEDVLSLAAICEPGSDYEIVTGPYPKKTIAWEKIKMAVDKGFADEDPNALDRYVGDYVFNPVANTNEISLDKPSEVLEGGTGFMMIQRSALEKYQAAYPEFMYKPDHVRTDAFDGTREIMAFFDCVVDDKFADTRKTLLELAERGTPPTPDELRKLAEIEPSSDKYSKRYLSEDYMFCQWARKAGIKIWLCPWMKLQHMGSYMFGGSLQDLAQLGAAATADIGEMNRQKENKAKRGAKKKGKK